MLAINEQRQEFENWMNNAAIKEPDKTNFHNWIVSSPINIYIPRIPPVECWLSAGSCQGKYNGYVFDISVHIDHFDWMSYINKEYSYISIDSEVNKYLNWIGDIPTGRFSIDHRTGYFHEKDYKNKVLIKKAYKKISVALIKEDWKFHEIEARKNLNEITS